MSDVFDRPDGHYERRGNEWVCIEEGINGDELHLFDAAGADIRVERLDDGISVGAHSYEEGIWFWLDAKQVRLLKAFLDAQEA